MVAKTLRILIFILFPSLVLGQSIELSVSPETSNNNPSTFTLQNGKVTITETNIRFAESGNSVGTYKAFGISPDKTMVGVLKRKSGNSDMLLFDSGGEKLNTYSGSQIGANDPSLAIFPFNNGSLLLRENITNFTFYDTLGEIKKSVSNSSGSEDGETISEVAMSPNAKTIAIYTPKIKRDGQLGSQVQAMNPAGEFSNIFFSEDRYLKNVNVSSDGNMVVAITAKSGTDDRVLIMDKFGNELNRISTDENLEGASLSADLGYLTLYSGRRVMVYNTLSGERVGATSVRTPVFLADYFPEDNILLMLAGDYSEDVGMMRGAEFQAVDLEKREITSREFSATLGFSKALMPRFVRTSADTYRLEGASKQIEIETNF